MYAFPGPIGRVLLKLVRALSNCLSVPAVGLLFYITACIVYLVVNFPSMSVEPYVPTVPFDIACHMVQFCILAAIWLKLRR